ncbi:TIGR01777 family oxidoreductase [Namhaeicola litoreus]|uniref:TIGR01777 family oxidoreductase n=1 Tax=Namhaeicola litoreus TaxID=1052145 RepID=A0ABW3XYS0_9FLAO
MQRVIISGASGLVGTSLCDLLSKNGYEVCILSRTSNPKSRNRTYVWDIKKGFIEGGALKNVDYIIHLAGAGIGDEKWTDQRKKVIVDSRVDSAQLLFDKCKELNIKPKAFISSSAVGWYGAITSEKIFDETDPFYDDFLGNTCKVWEDAADQFDALGSRVVKLRTGVVLAKNGGALKKLVPLVKSGFGSAVGTGNQYMPWVHIDDLCQMYLKALKDDKMVGAYNAVTNDFQSNQSFMKTMAKVLGKPFFMPKVPSFLLKIILGEQAVIILEGSRVSANKVLKNGFKFQFPKLGEALKDLEL